MLKTKISEKEYNKFYKHVVKFLEQTKRPCNISEVSKYTHISYSAAKTRLHRLEWNKKIIRLKRGYYVHPKYFKSSKTIVGKKIYINAGIRINPGSNATIIHIYNKNLSEKCGNKYCIIKALDDNTFEINKSDKYYGNKLYKFGTSIFLSIPRTRMTDQLKNKISHKIRNIQLIFYSNEWGLKEKEIHGTENMLEGQLASELTRYGNIEKGRKLSNIKTDLVFKKHDRKFLIEITNLISKKINKKSDTRSGLILMRFYFFVKAFLNNESDGNLIVINNKWRDANWLKKEIEFIKQYKTHVIFTNFKKDWYKKTALEINKLFG